MQHKLLHGRIFALINIIDLDAFKNQFFDGKIRGFSELGNAGDDCVYFRHSGFTQRIQHRLDSGAGVGGVLSCHGFDVGDGLCLAP